MADELSASVDAPSGEELLAELDQRAEELQLDLNERCRSPIVVRQVVRFVLSRPSSGGSAQRPAVQETDPSALRAAGCGPASTTSGEGGIL